MVQSLRSSGSLLSMKVRAAWRKVSPWSVMKRTGSSCVPRNSTRCRRRTISISGGIEFHVRGGIEIERAGLGVEEPFAGRIQFLEDVLDEAELAVGPALAVVLPAAFVGQVALGVLAGDAIVHAAPECGVHGVDEAAGRVRPARGTGGAEGIRGCAVEGARIGIEVRIAGHDLAPAVDEELIRRRARRNGRLHDAVLVGRPGDLKPLATADDGALAGKSGVGDRGVLGAGVRGLEDQRVRQIVCTAGQEDRDRP